MRLLSRLRKCAGYEIVILLIASLLAVPLLNMMPVGKASDEWWNSGWSYRKTVTIDHTKVVGSLSDFPILIDITDANLALSAQSDGDDIAFVDAGGTKLNHEIESFDSGSGRLVAHVKAPSLSQSTNAVVYMYYGNSGSGSQQNVRAVWDSNFMMVQHLNTGVRANDSTVNGNNGSLYGAVSQVAGKADGAYQFDGATGYVQMPHSNTLTGYTTAFTASFWIRLADVNRRQVILNKYDSNGNQRAWFIEYDNAGNKFPSFFASATGSAYFDWYANFSPVSGNWYYVTVVWESAKVPRFYINGQQVTTYNSATISQIFNNPGAPLHIGKSTYVSGRAFNGGLDEICLSNSARSANWILTAYNNQASPSTFYSVGPQEVPASSAPIISNRSPSNGATGVPVSISKLSFNLTDFQNDLINYTVTTSPDIGSGGGTDKVNGEYSMPIHNLNYATTYAWTVMATDGQNSNNETFTFTTQPMRPWWNTSWQYRRTITINHTKVSSSQTDFPVLIDLTDNGLATKAQTNGNDFVFTDANHTKLSHEIESYSSGTSHLTAWIKVPVLSSTTDTVLYMYYGNPACGNQQAKAAVWDSGNRLVLHLAETTGTHYDSTINGNNATPNNGVIQGTAGKIDGSDTFDGTNDYLQIPHSGTLTIFSQGFTASFWLRLDDVSRRQTIINKYNSGTGQRSWYIEFQTHATYGKVLSFFASQDGTNYREWHTRFTPTAGPWYFITITWEPSTIPKFYVNGVQTQTLGTNTITPFNNNVGIPLLLGRCPYDTGRYLRGGLDEVRISNPARNIGWILSSYNNQKDPTTIYQLGTEEAQESPRYTITVDVNGQGSVTKVPDQLIYAHNTSVQLTAVPNAGSTFSHWEGDLTGTTAAQTLVMISNKTVTAFFTQVSYTVTVNIVGNGSVTKFPDQFTYTYGTSVQLTASAESGWTFQTWSGDLSGNTNPAMIIINSNKVVNATFAETASTLGIDISFDSASIGTYSIGGNEINFTLVTESLKTGEVYTYWTYFKMTNTLNREVALRITNAASVPFLSTPSKEAEMVYSYDGDNWLRFTNHSYSSGIYTFTGNFTNNQVYVATFFPLTYTEMQEYTNAVDASPWAVKTLLGPSEQGREIALLKITNQSVPDTGKKVIYIIGRQHSAETCSSHMLKGMIDFLISDNVDAQRMRNAFVWYIVPMVNPDGVFLGKSRATSENRNANRDWKNNETVEINKVRDHITSINTSIGIDFFIDWHSQMDDTTWANFVYSPSGNTFDNILEAYTDFDIQYPSTAAQGSLNDCTAREWVSWNIIMNPMYGFEPTPHLHTWTIASLNQEGVNVAYAIDEYFTLEPFAIIVLPDTQVYSQSYQTIFSNQTRWIVNNVEDMNILLVLHEGDIVNNDATAQWMNANASMSLLGSRVPWAVLPGNHDGTNVGTPSQDLNNYNTYFPYSRFSSEAWFGDAYNGVNTNSFALFSGGKDDYIVFNFQYHPGDAVLAWANTTIASYPNRRAIVVTHDYLNTDGTRTLEGNHIWNSFVSHHAAQVFLVLCGHMHGEARRQDTVNGSIVYQVLADYQTRTNGGDGLLRILEFHPAQDTIYVKTFSPYHNTYETDADSQFTLDFDMSGRVTLTSADPDLNSTSNYRWMDVADQTYSPEFQNSYNYTQATVHASYNTLGESLTGKLIAQNLKPNFAYQLKLVGTPGTADNELIGLAGRWWQEEWNGTAWTNGQNLNNKGTGSSPNPNDVTYLTRKSNADITSPTGLHYRYTGYLLFDYFITDSKGDATIYFETGSCYHVLWKTTQRSRATEDGPLKTVTFDPDASQDAYDFDYPNQTISIFGEWERLPMGRVNLSPGNYDCEILLTEESFHGTGPLQGNWAAAMSTNISFTIAS